MSEVDDVRREQDAAAEEVVSARDRMNAARVAYRQALDDYHAARRRVQDANRALFDAISAAREGSSGGGI